MLKLFRLLIAAVAVCLTVPYAAAQVPRPISQYNFEEGSGTTTADEIRGAGFEGTIRGGVTWVPGRFGTALAFNGTSGYVYAPVAGKGSTNFTITAWVWFDSLTRWGTIVKNWGSSTVGTFHFGLDDRSQKLSNYLGFTDTSSSAVVAPNIMPTGRWAFVGTTFDGTTQRLFIDGTLVATNTVPAGKILAGLDLMSFGAKLANRVTTVAPAPETGWLDGKLDEITFWDVALSTAQLAEMQTGYAFSGTVSGLAPGKSVVVQNNGADDVIVAADGAFAFPRNLGYLSSYQVTVKTQPVGQTCVVVNGTGVNVSAAVTSVQVTCTTNTYTVGGTVFGLDAGKSIVVRNNGGDDVTVNGNGGFAFATRVTHGGTYAVAVSTQPPGETCTVINGSGTANAVVSDVEVICGQFSLGGTVTGLGLAKSVVLQNNGDNDLAVGLDGAFAFNGPVGSGDAYAVTVKTQPAGQFCVVTSGSGNASASVTSVAVACANTYTVGGTLPGLAVGKTVVLQNNGGDDLTVAASGGFTFATALIAGGSYGVTVKTQPVGQTCTVGAGTGTNISANVANVSLTCTTNTFTVGGAVSGLGSGRSVVLQNNAGDDLTVSANASFTFITAVGFGGGYAVTVKTQPAGQTCTVANGAGTVAANVTNVVVSCVTATYTVGGTVSGLDFGKAVVLRNNGSNDLTVSGNGAFTFSMRVSASGAYAVTVGTQPTGEVCSVSNSSGTANADVVSVEVVCGQFSLGGTVSGLGAGKTVVLQNKGGNSLTANANGAFIFAGLLGSGESYAVTVRTQPVGQACTVASESGTASANVTNVAVVCTSTFTVGGAVSGLGAGKIIVLQNFGVDDLTVATNGLFTFPAAVSQGGEFAVTIRTQPVGQTCTVANGTGTVSAGVTIVAVSCTTNAYAVGGTVSGLAAGKGVVLQNNTGDDLTAGANGGFTFTTPVNFGAPYSVTVRTQPVGQTCAVANGSGTASASVTSVAVTCTTTTYTIGGTVMGLDASRSVALRNNGGSDLTLSANGAFTFSARVNVGAAYAVTVFTQPTGETCKVVNGTGTANANVSDVEVICGQFTLSGTVSGLDAGKSVTLQNNGDNDLVVGANGAFTFTGLAGTGEAYSVGVLTQPVGQTCVVANGTGTASANVTNLAVTCATSTYTIGGTVSGLDASRTVVLRNNGGNDLTVSANGAFVFTTPVTHGGVYAVTVFTQPAGETCTVNKGTGTANATVNVVEVICGQFSLGGAVSGLVAGNSVVLQNNGGNLFTATANGAFTLTGLLGLGEAYAVTVKTQPVGQACTVVSGTGTASANVTNLAVACTSTYTVGGTVLGLAIGSTVVLQNSGADDLGMPTNGAFTFATRVASGGAYAVTVKTQPATQTCTVSQGSGNNMASDVTRVLVSCLLTLSPANATLRANSSTSGTLAGSGTPAGSSFSLVTNGANGMAVVNADGSYTFTPRSGFAGTDIFSYQACLPAPNQATCTTATVSVLVSPDTKDLSASTTPGTAVTLTPAEAPGAALGTGSALQVSTAPANGKVMASPDGTLLYTPNVGFSGMDSFTYQVCLPTPNEAACDTATASVTVGPVESMAIPTLSEWMLLLLVSLIGISGFRAQARRRHPRAD